MKGGVGKTTLAKYLSILGVQNGKKILLIDLCQNGDVSIQLGYDRNSFKYTVKDWITDEVTFEEVVQRDTETGIHFIPSNRYVDKIEQFVSDKYFDPRFILKEKINAIPTKYDYVIIDTHPSETNLMIVLPLAASDLILIPTKLNYSSVVAMERTLELVEKAKKSGLNIKFQIISMAVDTTKMGRELADFNEFLKEKGLPIAPVVKHSVIVDKLSFRGEELSLAKNKYAQQVMQTFKNVYKEMEELVCQE